MIRRSAVDKPVRSSSRTVQLPKRYQIQPVTTYPDTISPRISHPDPRYDHPQSQNYHDAPCSSVIHTTPPHVEEIPLFDFDMSNEEIFLSPDDIMLLCE